ncbi:MAG: hypothetical protein H6Q14_1214 [Bacteroidetes bacterium]|nr:hypothetical protein [Bacteroidota bacterium]
MKRSFFVIVLALVVVIPVFGQKPLRFGIRGGYDFLDQTLDKGIFNASNRTGYHVGLSLDADLPILPFGLNVSLLYTQQNIKNTDEYTFQKAYYLDVPVDLNYTIGVGGVGIVLSAGPYIRFNLDGGNINITDVENTYKAQTFQAGANFGVGVNLSSNFYVGVTYFTSLTDNYKETDPDFEEVFKRKPDRMALTGVYYF